MTRAATGSPHTSPGAGRGRVSIETRVRAAPILSFKMNRTPNFSSARINDPSKRVYRPEFALDYEGAVQVRKGLAPRAIDVVGNPWLAISAASGSRRATFHKFSLFRRGRQAFAIHFPNSARAAARLPRDAGARMYGQWKERCVACGLCEWACPTTCITIYRGPTTTMGRTLSRNLRYRLCRACMLLCGLVRGRLPRGGPS